jgi:hypothetical protein
MDAIEVNQNNGNAWRKDPESPHAPPAQLTNQHVGCSWGKNIVLCLYDSQPQYMFMLSPIKFITVRNDW